MEEEVRKQKAQHRIDSQLLPELQQRRLLAQPWRERLLFFFCLFTPVLTRTLLVGPLGLRGRSADE